MDVFELMATLKLDTSEYESGLSDAEQETQSLGSALGTAGKTIAAAGAGVAAVGGGLFAFANKSSQAADVIDKMSQKVGISSDAYQEWDYILNLSGTDMQSTAMGIKTLTNKFDDAINGSSSAVESFERLGLSMDDLKGMSREDLFSTVIFAFQDMEDNAERAALANDLLGRAGMNLAPLFNQTSDDTKDLIQNLHDVGGVMSEDAVKNGAAFQDSLTTLKASFAGVTNGLAKDLVPAITSLADKVTEFVASGGVDKIVSSFKALAPAITAAVAAMVAYKTATAISGVIQALTAATEGQTIAQTILNAVMNANPFVLVATLSAALVAAVITLWHTNDSFREGVEIAWEALKQMFLDLYNGFISIVTSIPEFLVGIWQTITAAVTTAFTAIATFFTDIWNKIKEIVTGAVNAVFTTVSNVFNKVRETASAIWTGIRDTLKGIIDGIRNAVTEKFNAIKEKITSIFTNIKTSVTSKITSIKEAITGGVQKAIDFLKDLPGKALSWGKDLIDNFVQGIKDKINKVKDTLKDVGNTVKDFLGFSEPEKGPLSNFHTFAPDMIDLFTSGIYDNMNEVARASSALASAMNPDMPAYSGTVTMAGTGGYGAENGDIIIPVYIGQSRIDEVIVTNEQIRNYRSGGR